MYVQRHLFRDAVSMTFNQTHETDLEKSGILLGLLLIMSSDEVSGYGQSGGDWRLLDKIGTISLTGNGDRVIRSLNAKEHQVFGFLGSGKTSPENWRNYASNTQFCIVPITLGRRWMDKEYGLNLANWDQVKLKVANTATASSFSTDIKLTVVAIWLRDVAGSAVRGYMKAEAHKEYVPVAGAWEYTDLPTMGRLHRLLVHPRPGVNASTFLVNTGAPNLAYEIKLMLKSRALPMMDHSCFREYMLEWYDHEGEVITQGMNYNSADKAFDVGIGRVTGLAGISGSKDGAGSSTVPTIAADNQDFMQSAESYEGDSPIHYLFRGVGFHNHISLPVAMGPNPEDMLDLQGQKQVTLDILCRSGVTVTDAKTRILVERPCTGVDQLV